MIPVTKPYLPDVNKYKQYIDGIYKNEHLTNNGPLLKELEARLSEYLGVKHVIIVSNGTIALQIAFKALDLEGQVITTPFSFVATTSSLVWEGLEPVFCDINPETLNIDPDRIENCISSSTSAIVPVHVYGNPCDVEAIAKIAQKNKLKIIYDAAHAFGVLYNRNSVLNYGDISTLSFHATKLFHTIEGGAIITNDDMIEKKCRLLMNFGLSEPDKPVIAGINGKVNEFQAAMGLCVLDDMSSIMPKRKEIWEQYYAALSDIVCFQVFQKDSSVNYSYVPILFSSEADLLKAKSNLVKSNIIPRRYFYPSLNQSSYLKNNSSCPVAEDLSKRVLCLPSYFQMSRGEVDMVISIIKDSI